MFVRNTSCSLGTRPISLATNESEVGSSLYFDPTTAIILADMGFLSSDGRCRAFDRDGSGYVRGEGICAVVLKRQSDAVRDGDRIRAVVRATGSNHDVSVLDMR